MEEDDIKPEFADLLGDTPYILIRVIGEHDEQNVDVSYETGGGFSQETGLEFLKAIIETAKEN